MVWDVEKMKKTIARTQRRRGNIKMIAKMIVENGEVLVTQDFPGEFSRPIQLPPITEKKRFTFDFMKNPQFRAGEGEFATDIEIVEANLSFMLEEEGFDLYKDNLVLK